MHEIEGQDEGSHDKNLDKFELYAKRNIFVVPVDAGLGAENVDNADRNVDQELTGVRERYIELQGVCQKLYEIVMMGTLCSRT